MNNIREILTKAVISEGRRIFTTTVKMPEPPVLIGRVLGAVMTNHQTTAQKNGNALEISGSYDVHVWYTYDEDKKTKISRTTVEYGDIIELVNPLREHLLISDEVFASEITPPHATDLRIESGIIQVDINFEIAVEVIGETKMRVAILGPVATNAPEQISYQTEDDYLVDIDKEINPHFLDAEILHFD